MLLNCGKMYRIKISQENSKHRMIDRLGAWMHRHPMFIAGMRVMTLLIVFLLMAHWFCCMYITIGNDALSMRRRTHFRHENRRVSGRNDYVEPTTTRMSGNATRKSRVSRIQMAQERAQEKLYEDIDKMKSAIETMERTVKSNSALLLKVLRHIDGDDSAEESI